MNKLPAFQFYPGDWRKDPGVQSLDYFERGVWLELLCLMHESEVPGKLLLGGNAYPVDRLARLLGLSFEVMGKVISDLITLNVASICPETGALMNRRMARNFETKQKRSEGGKLGGNPNFAKGKPNPYYQKDNLKKDKQKDNQNITSSSSSSSSISLKKKEETEVSSKKKPPPPKIAKKKQNPEEAKTRPDLGDEDWLVHLRSLPENKGIAVTALYGKMLRWCTEKGETPTRLRLLKWLEGERGDHPVTYVPAAPAKGGVGKYELPDCKECFNRRTTARDGEIVPCPDCDPINHEAYYELKAMGAEAVPA